MWSSIAVRPTKTASGREASALIRPIYLPIISSGSEKRDLLVVCVQGVAKQLVRTFVSLTSACRSIRSAMPVTNSYYCSPIPAQAITVLAMAFVEEAQGVKDIKMMGKDSARALSELRTLTVPTRPCRLVPYVYEPRVETPLPDCIYTSTSFQQRLHLFPFQNFIRADGYAITPPLDLAHSHNVRGRRLAHLHLELASRSDYITPVILR